MLSRIFSNKLILFFFAIIFILSISVLNSIKSFNNKQINSYISLQDYGYSKSYTTIAEYKEDSFGNQIVIKLSSEPKNHETKNNVQIKFDIKKYNSLSTAEMALRSKILDVKKIQEMYNDTCNNCVDCQLLPWNYEQNNYKKIDKYNDIYNYLYTMDHLFPEFDKAYSLTKINQACPQNNYSFNLLFLQKQNILYILSISNSLIIDENTIENIISDINEIETYFTQQ